MEHVSSECTGTSKLLPEISEFTLFLTGLRSFIHRPVDLRYDITYRKALPFEEVNTSHGGMEPLRSLLGVHLKKIRSTSYILYEYISDCSENIPAHKKVHDFWIFGRVFRTQEQVLLFRPFAAYYGTCVQGVDFTDGVLSCRAKRSLFVRGVWCVCGVYIFNSPSLSYRVTATIIIIITRHIQRQPPPPAPTTSCSMKLLKDEKCA